MATSFKFESAQGRVCPRCGGNEYERNASGWRCSYCGTVYSDHDDPNNPAPRIPVPVYVEKRNEQREKAHESIVLNLIPWAIVLVSALLFLMFYNPYSFYDVEYLLIIVSILGIIFGIRGIPKIRAAQIMLREIDASIRTNQNDQ